MGRFRPWLSSFATGQGSTRSAALRASEQVPNQGFGKHWAETKQKGAEIKGHWWCYRRCRRRCHQDCRWCCRCCCHQGCRCRCRCHQGRRCPVVVIGIYKTLWARKMRRAGSAEWTVNPNTRVHSPMTGREERGRNRWFDSGSKPADPLRELPSTQVVARTFHSHRALLFSTYFSPGTKSRRLEQPLPMRCVWESLLFFGAVVVVARMEPSRLGAEWLIFFRHVATVPSRFNTSPVTDGAIHFLASPNHRPTSNTVSQGPNRNPPVFGCRLGGNVLFVASARSVTDAAPSAN
jgi:hypothetical protein